MILAPPPLRRPTLWLPRRAPARRRFGHRLRPDTLNNHLRRSPTTGHLLHVSAGAGLGHLATSCHCSYCLAGDTTLTVSVVFAGVSLCGACTTGSLGSYCATYDYYDPLDADPCRWEVDSAATAGGFTMRVMVVRTSTGWTVTAGVAHETGGLEYAFSGSNASADCAGATIDNDLTSADACCADRAGDGVYVLGRDGTATVSLGC